MKIRSLSLTKSLLQTLHSTFSIDFGGSFTSLGDKKKDERRTILKNMLFLIVDEFSMIKSDYIHLLNIRLQELKQVYDKTFGGVCVLLMGDPMQLKPVMGSFPWECPRNEKYRLYNLAQGQDHEVNHLWQEFTPIMLKTNHRQGEEGMFADVLNRIRLGQMTEEDVSLMKTRIVAKETSSIPKDSIYIFATNAEVNIMNDSTLDTLEGEEFVVHATVSHRTNQNFKAPIENTGNIRNTNLQSVLRFKRKSKIMITYNLCTADGITNGTMGEVVDVVMDGNKQIKSIIVQFINPEAGKETRKGYKDLERKYGKPVVPIQKFEKIFSLDRQGTSAATATAYQFPIKPASAVTAHKVQGSTVKPPQGVVLDIKNVRNPAQVYVMASRAQKLEQLYIIDDLHLPKWTTSTSALQELTRLQRTSLNLDGVGNFDIACLNVRSLRKHHEDIKTLIQYKVDIICLQETWLEEDDNLDGLGLPDFNLTISSKGRGKGIATYFKSEFSKYEEVSEENLQMTSVTNKNIDIINIYRSSSNKTLKDRLSDIVIPDHPTIICGDLNCDITQENPDFLQTLQDLGFEKLNWKPTHDMGRNIDCLFVNSYLSKAVTFRQIGVGFSDHDCLLIKIG